ncbi:carbohydrate sulfotransferase 4-like [Discoglossus pictus]
MHTHLMFLLFLFLSLFITIIFISKFLNQSTLKKNDYAPLPQQKPVHLLIVSSWRSGSSFFGEIFNHHPDVFYLYEPGHPVWMRFQQESAELLHYPVRDLLHSLFTCDVSPLYSYLPAGGKRISEIKFFAETRALCFAPVCSNSTPLAGYDRKNCLKHCGNTPLEKMAEVCRAHSHVAMKTVRIFDFNILFPLFRDPALDLRILHLVRDPRAVTSSRRYFSLSIDDKIVVSAYNGKEQVKPTLAQVMAKICRSQVAINKVARGNQEFLRGRYMVIRHEDLAKEPFYNVKRIYNFAGLSLPKDLESWIDKVTRKTTSSENGSIAYSRNSSEVVNKWRRDLDFELVKNIQNGCQEAMELFGYLRVITPKEQKNQSLNLIEDMNVDEQY